MASLIYIDGMKSATLIDRYVLYMNFISIFYDCKSRRRDLLVRNSRQLLAGRSRLIQYQLVTTNARQGSKGGFVRMLNTRVENQKPAVTSIHGRCLAAATAKVEDGQVVICCTRDRIY